MSLQSMGKEGPIKADETVRVRAVDAEQGRWIGSPLAGTSASDH